MQIVYHALYIFNILWLVGITLF